MEIENSKITTLAKAGFTFLSLMAMLAGIHQYYESRGMNELAGAWRLDHRIESGPYSGLNLTFRIFLTQNGRQCSGNGEKWLRNGAVIPARERSRLNFSACTIDGSDVTVSYIETSKGRESGGFIRWKLSNNRLDGIFNHSTGSSGSSVATRIQ